MRCLRDSGASCCHGTLGPAASRFARLLQTNRGSPCSCRSGGVRGRQVIIEPYDERMPTVSDPVIQLACLDASLAMAPVFKRFQSVIITSGTLSPIDLYPRLLGFKPVVCLSLQMTLTRRRSRPPLHLSPPPSPPLPGPTARALQGAARLCRAFRGHSATGAGGGAGTACAPWC